jgi:type 1 glutamine amidotransferase
MNREPSQVSRRRFLHATGGAASAWFAGRRLNARGAHDKRLVVCLISGSLEYKSDESLVAFEEYVQSRYPMRCTRAFRRTDDDLPGLENLETCDVALFFTRRLTIAGEQLERVKRYCAAGRPIVGVRTASHGFQRWLEMDREVFGGDYGKHYGSGPRTKIEVVPEAKAHPILKDFRPFESVGTLYRNRQIAQDTTLLLRGHIPGQSEPLAWTRQHRGGRVFYTSLGHPDDFQQESFRRLLARAVLWVGAQEAAS